MVLFDQIPNYSEVKKQLFKSVQLNKVSHAQIFYSADGAPGYQMALAYLQLLFCRDQNKPCGQCSDCNQIASFTHPDLHFSFPHISTDSSNNDCNDFMETWRSFLTENPYFLSSMWKDKLDTKNKQPQIYTAEGKRILRTLSLKSYSGHLKALVIWQPELLNNHAANKLLKFIEEPEPNTIILMVSHNTESILDTIKSRCQIKTIGLLNNEQIQQHLTQKAFSNPGQIALLCEGNLGKAYSVALNKNEEFKNTKLFIDWLRVCFKGIPKELLTISEEMATNNRDTLKRLIADFQKVSKTCYSFSSTNSQNNTVATLEKVAPFINDKNIESIYLNFENALLDINRNGNNKIILYDLALKTHLSLHSGRS